MKKNTALLFAFLGLSAVFAVASQKISDDAYRLVRQLVSYKNHEIDMLKTLSVYTLECNNVSDEQFAVKKCSQRMEAMQGQDRELQVRHDVLGHDIKAHISQHKDEEWL